MNSSPPQTTMSSGLQLPIELLYTIISRTWSSTLTPSDRIRFMTSSKLVSKTWTSIYEDIFSADIHVPCKPFYYHLFNDVSRNFSLCRSITFTVSGAFGELDLTRRSEHHGLDGDVTDPPPALSLNFMSTFDMAKLTSLQRLNIVYYNASFPDPCAQGFFLSLPKFLQHLTVSYTFSPDIPASTISDLRKRFTREVKVRYAQPKVGTIEINGADEYIAAIWESLFPDREKLIRDGKEEKQRLIPVDTPYDLSAGATFVLQSLLGNLIREREFHDLHAAPVPTSSGEDGMSERASGKNEAEGNDDDDELLPPPPDVTRSPTERSVEMSPLKLAVDAEERFYHLRESDVHGAGVKFIWMGGFSTLSLSPTIPLGQVGFVNGTGTFRPLFNAFEPHITQGSTIPSVHGYGDMQRARPSTSSEGGGMMTAKRAFGAIFKRRSKPNKGNREPESLDKSVAERWFRANVDRIVGMYGRELGVRKDNVLLVTSSVG